MRTDHTLVTIDNPFDIATRRIVPVSFMPGRTIGDLAALSGLARDQAVVVRNGRTARDLSAPLLPGDIVHVCPRVHEDFKKVIGGIGLAVLAYYVGPAVSSYLQSTAIGMSEAAATFWGSAAALATVSVGGMLLNSGASAPVIPSYGAQTDSPTYGWNAGQNTAQEGIAIPVIVGEVATWPQIINQWIEVDNDTDEQWIHTLLSVANGKTNNVPAAGDIQVNGQPITILPEKSYTIETTDGGPNPVVLAKHEKLHQMRPIQKEMVPATLSQILLHFDGTDGSTDIVDSAVGIADDPNTTGDTTHVNSWICTYGAQLSTAHPFNGTAAIDLTAAQASILCNEPLAFDIWTRDAWDFECRFRQASLYDSGIIGQAIALPTAGEWMIWGIFYNHSAGSLVFQQYFYDDNAGTWTIYFNVSAAATLSADTWHHIRLARSTAYSNGSYSSATIYFFLDGTLLGQGNSANQPTQPASGGAYVNSVGRAYFTDGSSSNTWWYGGCELDELRLNVYSYLYDLSGFTPPTNPIADDGEQTFFTKGVIDSFSVIIQCPYGLFQIAENGDHGDGWVLQWISYRKIGDTNWVRKDCSFNANTRNPISRQFTFTPDAGRGKYEIRVSRLHWWNAEAANDNYIFQTTAFLAHIDEILHESLTYPHLQLASVSILAQDKLSGSAPVYRIFSRRTSIEVPTYDNTDMRTIDPTNNANLAFDMLTNRIYGPGIDPRRLIEADWQDWADWCDGLVGGNKRCQINMAFDQTYKLSEALQNVENCGRARVTRRGTLLTPVIDRPRAATDTFVPAKMTPGTNTTKYLRQAERSDAVWISYYDKDQDFTLQTKKAESSGYNNLTRVARITKVTLRGINNGDQAQREAILRQQISEATKRAVSFQTGLEGLPVIPGDVFNYGHGGNRLIFSGRLSRGAAREEKYTGITVYLDREITLDNAKFNGNCLMIVRNPDDTLGQYTVTGPFDEATRSITVAAAGTFDFLSPYMILRAVGETYQYRVDSIKRSSEKDVAIEGRQYVESAYFHPNYDGGATAI